MHTSLTDTSFSRKTPQSACEDLANHLQEFDFCRFFEKFPLDSPISKFVESFCLSSLRKLMERAFASTYNHHPDSSSARSIMRARRQLEEELQNIDAALRIMEAARLNVRRVRDSLGWIRTVNRRSLEECEATLPSVHGQTEHVYGRQLLPPSGPPNSPQRDESQSFRSPGHHRSGSLPYWERHPSSPSSQSTSGHRSRYSISVTPSSHKAKSNFHADRAMQINQNNMSRH
ncbi:hypothetical protein K439DRAFT_1629793 [Ramaria rubella]|nr:hypothetical protein K439DRAFT_1629793 [Ramaria rubella]